MDGQAIRELLQANKEKLFATYPLESMALFGSYADGTAREDSDVDIMVEFNRPVGFEFVDLCIELENLLQKPVDLVTASRKTKTYALYRSPATICLNGQPSHYWPTCRKRLRPSVSIRLG